jgi:integrase
MCEIKKIWGYIDNDGRQMSPQTKCALKFLLLTGVRTFELRLATWDQFKIDESLWTIPKKNTKTDVIHKIHLSSQVKALFDELKQISTSRYIIAGAIDDEPLTENALARAVRRTHKYIGIPHWTVHDLRRTFSTHLDETLHINPIVIEKCLAHRMPKIMAVYNKSEMLPERRDALNQWGQYIENLVTNSNVVALEFAV